MTLEEIKENFDSVWKQNHDFIPISSKKEAERFKRKGIRFEQESVKKLKTSKEAFPLPVMEFPLPREVLTVSKESSHCQKKRDATAHKIALLLKSSSNWDERDYDYENRYHPAQREASKGVNTLTKMLKGFNKQFERKEDGGLYLAKRIWVPVYGNLKTLIMNEAYATKYSIHLGADKMYYDL
nr:putative reverse transcriptase domain-containing protein [Tanacetum cinerariifolium]